MFDEEYRELLASVDLKPLDYKQVADDWESRQEEWYHAMISEEDLSIILGIPNLKIYAWCRCKMIDIDKSESHLHWHALVHFTSGKLASWKQKAWRHKIKFASKKNTFKRIICLDHVVGVLRYVACSDGQHSLRRGPDGKVTHPHSHYQRQPISDHHRHKRGKDCSVIRKWISAKIACHLDLKDKPNWNAWELHNVQSCKCDRGSIGKKKKEDANEKRKAFYKTEKGIAIKQMYKDRIAMKKKLLKQLSTMNVRKKCQKQLFDIEKLVKML